MSRYSTSGIEGQYEPGSDEQVLANILGITDPEKMDEIELELLDQLYESVFDDVQEDQSLNVSDLKKWHRMWLGNVYGWAGEERSVNMSKPGFTFAASVQIPQLLEGFESNFLGKYTPCTGFTKDELVEAITVVHVEFILIHPYREGNGRLSRLLANVMALQAGWPELDFSLFDEHKEYYFKSIQAGVDGDLSYLERLVEDTLRLSINAEG